MEHVLSQPKIKDLTKLIDFGFDTKLFSPVAELFEKNGKYPDKNQVDWWKEQKKILKKGYTVNGWKITGEHYGYLNFNKIKLTEDKDLLGGKVSKRRSVIEKKTVFPKFWDGDYVFYWCKEIAKKGMDEDEYLKLKLPIKIRVETDIDGTRYVGGGKNLCVGKKRRFGASYKLAYNAAHNYETKPTSMTILAAYDMKYLTKDGIMSKTKRAIDFFDVNCEPFRKRRLKNDTEDIMSGYKQNVGGVETDAGYRSRVAAISFGLSADAVRGQDVTDIFVEESGKAPNLIAMTNATIDSLSDGASKSGTIIWFGTGGGKDNNWAGFKEIFYNPTSYGALEIENEWDENALGTYCGLFIPDYWNVVGYMSEYGESYINEARKVEEAHQIEVYLNKNDVRGLTARKMEHPFCPADAFNVTSKNIFDIHAIRTWKNYLKYSGLNKDLATVGRLERKQDGELKFEIDNKMLPIYEYPPPKGVTKGAVVVWDFPKKFNGLIPANLYIIDVDGYRHDQTSGDSVGAIYVSMNTNNLISKNLGDRLVASYVARPQSQDDFNKVLYDLAEFYNAKIAFENDEPAGIVDYGKRFKKLDRVESQFELAYDEKLKTGNTMKRGFGMHMGSGKNNERILTGDGYIKDWLETTRYTDEDGKETLNLHTIYDIGLLEELERYNPETGNFDRVAAFRIRMYHTKEMIYKNRQAQIKAKSNKVSFFHHNHFQ